jgi:hypothetical protein
VEQRPVNRRLRRAIGVAIALAVLGTTAWLMLRDGTTFTDVTDISDEERAPADVRIRVRVVNASTVRGLARRATQRLRDRGFDVVETGNTAERRDSVLVIDHTGHPDWARRVAAAFGGARIEARPDTLRYLDITVVLGRTWTPPAQPFYP